MISSAKETLFKKLNPSTGVFFYFYDEVTVKINMKNKFLILY